MTWLSYSIAIGKGLQAGACVTSHIRSILSSLAAAIRFGVRGLHAKLLMPLECVDGGNWQNQVAFAFAVAFAFEIKIDIIVFAIFVIFLVIIDIAIGIAVAVRGNVP